MFRYTALGAALALLAAFANLGHHGVSVPAAPPPPATLGASYTDRGGAAVSPAPTPAGPIAPSRSLSGMTVRQDPRAAADRFGTVGATHPQRNPADARP